MSSVQGTVAAVWKQESARLVAGLLRMVRDVGRAEELAQDALVAALEQWPVDGVPDNPGAWLTTVAKRRAIDHLRRTRRLDRIPADELDRAAEDEPARDDVLRLMFISCHPVLPATARAALTLRVIAGLTPAEIARAFLVAEPVIAHRIAAAKRSLAAVPYEMPAGPELAARLSSVLEVIYLIFNEGYSATAGTDLMRPALGLEALRLGRLLAELAPDQAEVHGLVALMEIQQSRAAARTGPAGEPVPLHEQNRGRWDRLLIRRGFTAMLRARAAGGAGPYVLQAAIAVCHAQAPTADQTDWAQIAALYSALEVFLPTPIVRLNRAVAVGFAQGPQAGLDLIDTLAAALPDYHLLPSVRGDLLRRLGRLAEARHELTRAAALTRNDAERDFLLDRAATLDLPARLGPALGPAIDEFLARPSVSAATTRAYRQTLLRVRRGLGDRTSLAEVTPARLAEVLNSTWPAVSSRTWNRHLSAIRSFAAWAGVPALTDGLSHRAVAPPTARMPLPEPAAAWGRPDVALRERVLWAMLHESAAPIGTILSLDIDHLDVAGRQAHVPAPSDDSPPPPAPSDDRWARRPGVPARSEGRRVVWGAETARWLPALIGERTRGPLFLSDRRPGPARRPAAADLCPETGRRRLSYERAEYLFKRATGHRLGQLRAR